MFLGARKQGCPETGPEQQHIIHTVWTLPQYEIPTIKILGETPRLSKFWDPDVRGPEKFQIYGPGPGQPCSESSCKNDMKSTPDLVRDPKSIIKLHWN